MMNDAEKLRAAFVGMECKHGDGGVVKICLVCLGSKIAELEQERDAAKVRAEEMDRKRVEQWDRANREHAQAENADRTVTRYRKEKAAAIAQAEGALARRKQAEARAEREAKERQSAAAGIHIAIDQRDQLAKALRFYADEDNWLEPESTHYISASPVVTDGGAIARAALTPNGKKG